MEQEERRKKEEIKKENYKKAIREKLNKQKEENEKAQYQKQLLQELIQRPDVISIISAYEKQLTHIFKHFAKMNTIRINDKNNQQLSINSFAKFSTYFNITPSLISIEETLSLFKQLTKGEGQAIDYSKFEEALIRIAVMVKERLGENGEVMKGDLNKNYENVSSNVIDNLLVYMNVRKEDTKLDLNKRLNESSNKVGIKKPSLSVKGTVTNSPRMPN